MKALVYTGPEALDYRETNGPVAAPGDVLVRVRACGICGSDMHAFLGHDERRPAPLILGHEAAGVIEGGDRDGMRVTINPLKSCGTCRACREGRDNLCPQRAILSMPPREGAFAEYVTTPPGNCVKVPEEVSLTKASLAEPLACGWHTVRLTLEAAPEAKNALVIGGGAIGLGAALCAAAQGIETVVITEPNETRRAALADMGHDARAPEEAGQDYDIVIDGVGFEATRADASARVRPGGVIGHIGLGSASGGLDIRRMTLQEITFIGTYTYTAQDFRDTCAAIFDGRLGPLDWTEERALADGAQAFADIRSGKVPAPKIVLIP